MTSFGELLNSEMDFASLWVLVRRGLAWWRDELAAMLPAVWRDSLSSRPRVWIEGAGDGGWIVWRDGRGVASPGRPVRSRDARVGLLAPAGAVLIRDIPVPQMPISDLRRMVALDIDRLSPLTPGLIHFDLATPDRAEGEGQPRAALAILYRAEAERLVMRARADGYQPVALSVRSEDDGGGPRFDFLPQVLSAEGIAPAAAAALPWRIAVAALILANVAVLVGRDVIAVDRLRAVTQAQRPVVDAVMRLRRRVETEDQRRQALIALGRQNDPLRMLNSVTQALPPGAWVQRLEWNGQTLRLVGFARREIDMGAAIRGSGAFANPRILTSPPTTGPTPFTPFDITADARPESR
jgi:general secretion pathway protein L